MNNLIKRITFFSFIVLPSLSAHSQSETASPSLKEILDHASARSREYVDTFKNLSADETKTFVIYKKNGDEKKRKAVRSLFLVVQLTKEPDRVVEFRNVVSVDGKVVENGDKRAQGLFEKLANAETSEAEIRRLSNEGSRYDEQIYISGMTLFQTPSLDPDLRPYFQFVFGPANTINGRTAYTVHYSQMRETPKISVNGSGGKSPSASGHSYDIEVDKEVPLNARLSGTLVIDAESFRILSETRQLTIQPEGFDRPAIAIEDRFAFQESNFGIYTPKRITHAQFKAKVKDREMVKEAEITFDYGSFTRADVEVKSGEIKP